MVGVGKQDSFMEGSMIDSKIDKFNKEVSVKPQGIIQSYFSPKFR